MNTLILLIFLLIQLSCKIYCQVYVQTLSMSTSGSSGVYQPDSLLRTGTRFMDVEFGFVSSFSSVPNSTFVSLFGIWMNSLILNIEATVIDVTTAKMIARVSVPDSVSVYLYGISFFASSSNEFQVIDYDFSTHSSFSQFTSGSGSRSLDYSVNYTQPFLSNNLSVYLSFRHLSYASSSPVQMNSEILEIANSYVRFKLSIDGSTLVNDLKGTILVIANSSQDSTGYNYVRGIVDDPIFQNTAVDHHGVLKKFYLQPLNYYFAPRMFVMLSSFSWSGNVMNLNYPTLGFDGDKLVAQLQIRKYADGLIYSMAFDILAFCSTGSTCLRPGRFFVIDCSRFYRDFVGSQLFHTAASSKIEYVFEPYTNGFASRPKYIGIGFEQINIKPDFKYFSVSVDSWTSIGHTVKYELGASDYIYSIITSTITSDSDNFQIIYYDFSNHSNFASYFGNSQNLVSTDVKFLEYVIYFKQTPLIPADVEVSVLFNCFQYTNSPTDFGIYSEKLSSTSNSVSIRVYVVKEIAFTKLSGYVTILGETYPQNTIDMIRSYSTDSVLSTPDSSVTRRYVTTPQIESRRRYRTNPPNCYFLDSYRWQAIKPGTQQQLLDMQINYDYSSATRKIKVNAVLSTAYDTITKLMSYTCFLYNNNPTANYFILEASISSPNPSLSQNAYIAGDFIQNNYIMFITTLSRPDDCQFYFPGGQTRNPRILRIINYSGSENHQRYAVVTPLDIFQSEFLTFRNFKIRQDQGWCVSLYNSYFSEFPMTTSLSQSASFNFNQPADQNFVQSIQNTPTLVASKLFTHDSTVQITCKLSVTFQGIIRGLFVGHEFILAGSSSDTNAFITIQGVRTVSFTPEEYIYVTINGRKLNITNLNFYSCVDNSNSIVSVQFTQLLIDSQYEPYYDLSYSSNAVCPLNCDVCKTSMYCYKCSSGYFNYNDQCTILCPQEASIPTRNQYCDNTQRSTGLAQTESTILNSTLYYNLTIDPFSTFSFILTIGFPYYTNYTNVPVILGSSKEQFSLVEASYMISNYSSITSSFSHISSMDLLISVNDTDPLTKLLVYSARPSVYLMTQYQDQNTMYSLSKKYLNDLSYIVMNPNNYYIIQFLLICNQNDVCKFRFTFDGSMKMLKNERTLLFNYYNISVLQTQNLSTNITGYNYLSIYLWNNSIFSLNVSGTYTIYSQELFLFEDTVPINSTSSCFISNCINCLNDNFCMSCNPGTFLSYDSRKCNQYCIDPILESTLENKCICNTNNDCSFPSLSRCDSSTQSCQACQFNTDCDHLFDSKRVKKCINGTCVQCNEDCNLCTNSSYCLVCNSGFVNISGICYYSCPPGMVNISRTVCSNICGDGKKPLSSGLDVCDDGNTLNGDGCSADCKKEKDFNCMFGGPYSPDICSPIPKLKIYQDKKNKNLIYLKFSQSMDVSSSEIASSMTATFLNTDYSNYGYTINQKDSTLYEVDFNISKTIKDQTLKIQFNNLSSITNLYGISLEQNTFSINIEKIEYVSAQAVAQVAAIKSLTGDSLIGGTGVASALFVSNANPNLVWVFVNLLQYFYYLLLINVEYPFNAKAFFELFAMGRLDFLANPFSSMLSEFQSSDFPCPQRFEDNEFSGNFLNNSGSMLALWLIAWALYLFYFPVYAFAKSCLKPFLKILTKYRNYFEFSGAIRLWVLYYIDLNISIFLNIRIASFRSMVFTVATGISFGFLAASLLVLWIVYQIVYKWNSINPRKKRFFVSLRSEFKTMKFPSNYFILFQMVRRLLTAFILVFLHDYPFTEILFLLIINTIPALISVAASPYRTLSDKISNGVTELSYFIIHVLILSLVYDNRFLVLSDENRIAVGWLIIFCCLMSLATNVFCMFAELIGSAIKFYKGVKNNSPYARTSKLGMVKSKSNLKTKVIKKKLSFLVSRQEEFFGISQYQITTKLK